MEGQRKHYDVLVEAQSTLETAQLTERPVFLQPFVVHDLLGVVSDAHDQRVENGVHEPLYDGGQDIAHELVEKMALALPATNEGHEVEVPLNDPQIKFIRSLLEEERQKQGGTQKNGERASDLISFENAVKESLFEARAYEFSSDDTVGLTDGGREMVTRLLKEREKYPRRLKVRAAGSLFLQWKLASFLDEEQLMRPKYSPEFDDGYEVGKKTLRAFGKEKTIDKDDKGNPKHTQVILTREQVDYLTKNVTILTTGVAHHQAVQIRGLVAEVGRSFDSAPMVVPRAGKLKKFFVKFTGQK